MNKQLPPLPPSDEESLNKNRYDGFYEVRAKDFWGKNEVVREVVYKDKKCGHNFIYTDNGAECTKCHIGFVGKLEVRDGNLYHHGKKLPL